MTNPKLPNPAEILAAAQAAAQAAAEAAQAAAGSAFDSAVRLPPASARLAAELPDLVDNLASTLERLNDAIDRWERMMVLMDPMFGALDRLIPQLEALVSVGDNVFARLGRLPGMGTLGKVTGVSVDKEKEKADERARGRTKARKQQPPTPGRDRR
ncbi:hypothetical protein OG921_05745 [Aldersonia sp. NBC_00410]|uniref:hypothetical protein n=1 Tax=Aldersonia sp. NBC_00410 TaxID=2975954 RepID=UPI0022577D1D|nr:hypothetical protein [Aldersonia sp. NBC_00410]MCX5042671.1 hypothetical protein [Aldersonia sp. NBC_00410]